MVRFLLRTLTPRPRLATRAAGDEQECLGFSKQLALLVYLAARPETPKRLGAVGVSYALGPVILAALDPKIGHRLAFIVGIGGYYDAHAVLAFFTTGYYRTVPGGKLAWRKPNDYGKWLFVLSNLIEHEAGLMAVTVMGVDADRCRAALRPPGRADPGKIERTIAATSLTRAMRGTRRGQPWQTNGSSRMPRACDRWSGWLSAGTGPCLGGSGLRARRRGAPTD